MKMMVNESFEKCGKASYERKSFFKRLINEEKKSACSLTNTIAKFSLFIVLLKAWLYKQNYTTTSAQSDKTLSYPQHNSHSSFKLSI